MRPAVEPREKPAASMRFEQDTACRGTHCASTPLPATLQQPQPLLHHQHQLGLQLGHLQHLQPSQNSHSLFLNSHCQPGRTTELAPYAVAGSKESPEASADAAALDDTDHQPPAKQPRLSSPSPAARPGTASPVPAPELSPPRTTTTTPREDEDAKTVLSRPESGGPGMAYPAPALSRHSPFASATAAIAAAAAAAASSATTTSGAGSTSGSSTTSSASSNPNGRLPGAAAPRPTDFSVSSLLTAASSHTGGSSSQGSASPPPGGPGSPAIGPDSPPPASHRSSSAELTGSLHPSSVAANYFGAAALAAAGFYNPGAHLPPAGSPNAHHLSGKGILGGSHPHPAFSPQGIGPPG